MTAVSLISLSKSFGSVRVLQGIDLEIQDGCFFTLLGPSGCGKTTLLRLLAGFVSPEQGQIMFGVENVTRLAPHKRNIGMVFQDYALFPDKTVFDNVAYGLRARRLPSNEIRKLVHDHLEKVDLSGLADRSPANLSGGQRQRVALARALVISPRVLLMDEPLSNLDAKLRVQMREFIRDLQRTSNITTVFVTHDQEEALALSDRIAVMHGGTIEQVGTPQEIYATPLTPYVADFVGAANLIPAKKLRNGSPGKVVCDVLGTQVTGRLAGSSSPKKLMLVTRPEEIAINIPGKGNGRSASNNTLKGTVIRSQYLGPRIAYTVSLSEEILLNIDSSSSDHRKEIPDGTQVELHLGPDCLFVGDSS